MSIPSSQKAVVVDKVGGPEVLTYTTNHPIPEVKEGQVLVKNLVAGINFIDTYFRSGLYHSPKPEVLGREAAGIVVAVGPGAEKYNLKVGDRVIWLANSGYAEYTAAPAEKTVKLPEGVPEEDAVASFMSGLTALSLLTETYEVKRGDWVLLHAAAGGAGYLISQILTAMGAHVIATAGGPEKVALVKGLGVDHVIDYRSEEGSDWVQKVLDITNGEGVDVVYDSVGKDTWAGSLEVVKRKGTIVWFGNASGPIPPLSLQLLAPKCVKVARPTLFGYITTREEFEHYSDQIFELLKSRKLKVNIHKIYPAAEIQQAHKDLESRKTMGKLLLRV